MAQTQLASKACINFLFASSHMWRRKPYFELFIFVNYILVFYLDYLPQLQNQGIVHYNKPQSNGGYLISPILFLVLSQFVLDVCPLSNMHLQPMKHLVKYVQNLILQSWSIVAAVLKIATACQISTSGLIITPAITTVPILNLAKTLLTLDELCLEKVPFNRDTMSLFYYSHGNNYII
jgi:hypothetical protein